MSETRLANQSTVEFCGLQGRADLNGKRGVVKGFVAEKDRYAVVVDEWPAREAAPVLIKRANLRFIAEPGSADRFHAANQEEAERDSKEAAEYRAPPEGFQLDMPVTIVGLKSKPELNGCVAAITGWNPASERLQVLTVDSATELSLKPENCAAGTFATYVGDALLSNVPMKGGDGEFGECVICQDNQLVLTSPMFLCCAQAMCDDVSRSQPAPLAMPNECLRRVAVRSRLLRRGQAGMCILPLAIPFWPRARRAGSLSLRQRRASRVLRRARC